MKKINRPDFSLSYLKDFYKANKKNIVKWGSIMLVSGIVGGLGGGYLFKRLTKTESLKKSNIEIKLTEEGFRQYNDGLLVRELKKDITFDYEYNSEGQMIKSSKFGKSLTDKTTFYAYDEDGLKNMECNYPAKGFDEGSSKIAYKRDEKDSIIEEEVYYSDVNGKFWTEIKKFNRDEEGRVVGIEKKSINNQTEYALKDGKGKLLATDYDGDGKVDIVERK